MTGLYLRVQRDGRWQNIEMDQLTDAEFTELEEERKNDALGIGWRFAISLAKWIRDNVKESDTMAKLSKIVQIGDLQPGQRFKHINSTDGRLYRVVKHTEFFTEYVTDDGRLELAKLKNTYVEKEDD